MQKKAGIADDKIILDPGVGFAKSYEQNLIITNNVDRLNELGYPVLLRYVKKVNDRLDARFAVRPKS